MRQKLTYLSLGLFFLTGVATAAPPTDEHYLYNILNCDLGIQLKGEGRKNFPSHATLKLTTKSFPVQIYPCAGTTLAPPKDPKQQPLSYLPINNPSPTHCQFVTLGATQPGNPSVAYLNANPMPNCPMSGQ